jgi:CRISPR-associated RAMP protein (TIGR02581 family)
MFERLKNRYLFKGIVILDTALHIGSGQSSFETDALVIKDAHEKPYIPGSSFKGTLRSTVERMVPNIPGLKTCALIEGADCATVNNDKMDQFKRRLKGEDKGDPLELVCDTCKVFGSTVIASKVKIPDLYVSEPYIGLFERRDGVGIDRDTETAAEGAKFDYEVVSSQTGFEFEMICENFDKQDKFLLALGLREMESKMVSLGGNTSRGLGAFRLVINEVTYLDFEDKKSLVDYLTSQELKKIEPADFIKESLKTFLAGSEVNA